MADNSYRTQRGQRKPSGTFVGGEESDMSMGFAMLLEEPNESEFGRQPDLEWHDRFDR